MEPSIMTTKKATARIRCAIYSRVSTDHQTTENQERELIERAERAGWEVVKVYKDQGISGARSGKDRPAFDAMRKDAAKRKFDVVAAWSVDRLGRSLQTLVEFLSDIHGFGVDLYLHQQGVDTTTPAGKALFQMMGVFAEMSGRSYASASCRGWTREGARAETLGAGPSTAEETAIRADLVAAKAGIIKLAAAHGVGVGTVQRIKAAMAA